MTFLSPAEVAGLATMAARFLPDQCDILRFSGGGYAYAGAISTAQQVATGVPCLMVPQAMEDYPFPAIPNQPQTRWAIRLPAGTDVRNNDILALDGAQRLFVVMRTEAGRSYQLSTLAYGVLSAVNGALGDAYLRPNATVQGIRSGFPFYGDRRVHLTFPQANPAAAIERITGGVATLRIAFFDVVDADWSQGDFITILSEDGASVLPDVATFKLAGVLRRPMPLCVLEADAIADIIA